MKKKKEKATMKINLYTVQGAKKTPGLTLPKKYQEKINLKLLAQTIRVYESNRHPGLSKSKTRSEIVATKKKWYRQKGTGGARHGAKSAPIFVGGGKAHGPKGLKRELSLSKKMKTKAFAIAMSLKVKEGKMLAVDGLGKLSKTKETADLIKKIIKAEKYSGKNNRFSFALSEKNKNAIKAIRNLKNANVMSFRNLNAYKVYFGGIIVVDSAVLEEDKGKNKIKPKSD